MIDRKPTLCVVAGPNGSEMRYECLEQKRDFVFETVFSSHEKLEFLQKAKGAGFFIRLFYVCTSDPAINVARITQRYLNGGHEVPISKVISRYYKSLVNATKAISFVDRAYVYDNSVDNQLPCFRRSGWQDFWNVTGGTRRPQNCGPLSFDLTTFTGWTVSMTRLSA